MIYKESFDLGMSNLIVSTIKELKDNEKESIRILIDSFSKELNHNISDSSAWRFNNAQIFIGIYIQPEFIQYFKYVLNLYKKYPDTFAPFGQFAFKEDMASFDESENIAIKTSDFKFDTAYFRNLFITEYVASYLKELKVQEFLIEHDNICIANGENGWLINKNGIQHKLVNKACCFFFYKVSGFKTHKFGAIDNELSDSEAIVVGNNPAELKILAPQIQYLNTKTDVARFAQENEVQIVFANTK